MSVPYLDDLAKRLRSAGVPADQVTGIVDDLTAYAAESGADPEAEFGPVEAFARQLAGDGENPGAETWRWTADAFHEVQRMNELGDQGWEVERVDGKGMFVSRRDTTRPQRWQYRRETVLVGGGRRRAERLAPDGWEPCGNWLIFQYFKRPKAVSEGPAAELDTAPDTPARRIFWSRRFYAFFAAWAVLVVAMGLGLVAAVRAQSTDDWLAGLVGGLLGVGGVAAWIGLGHRRERRRDRGSI